MASGAGHQALALTRGGVHEHGHLLTTLCQIPEAEAPASGWTSNFNQAAHFKNTVFCLC